MKRHCLVFALLLIAAGALFNATAQTRLQSSQTVLHYKDVVGTYEEKITGSRISVERAPHGLLRISIGAVYPYRTANGEMTANTGEAEGTVKLVGDTAFFKPEGTEGCTIKLVFKPQSLIVTQQGADYECGFGHNVTAEGAYKLKSRRVERFDETSAPIKQKRRG
jgi:hypothetical protein